MDKEKIENMKKILEGKIIFRFLLGLGVLIIMLLIFVAGISVGYHKASFGRTWGEHYRENFGMGQSQFNKSGMMGGFNNMMGSFPNAHGAIGKILKNEGNNIILQDKDNLEKSILLSDDTKIQKSGLALTPKDLQINDFIVVIGGADDKGVIEAKFIRVIPNPESLK